ncbi:hypothetical protein CALVIDRAFT_536720 [Calocera viscosa TUFC12733]|uniref:Uncharacterized protein n=1 Tax=Calocera viscosa (strain TUFC12733) TaxID=1330018 RepID=A0A167MK31_CALVF|nr:hypothetical protein CALVIDRAFT_536720 [Calocera viscosa TUFC12733]
MSTSSSSRSRRSSSIGDRPAVYPDPIGTPRKAAPTSPATSSSPEPITPPAPNTFCAVPEEKEQHRSQFDHPCLKFWKRCSLEHLETLEQFVALWIKNGLQAVESDWRTLDVSEREKEQSRRTYADLLEQYAALRSYRLYRSGCTAEQLLDELSA